MSDSLLGRLPELAGPIELIAAANPRLASRYAHMLKAGRAVDVEALEDCPLIIVQARGAEVQAAFTALQRAKLDWAGRSVVLIDDELDASALEELRQLKANVCAAALAPPPKHPVLVADGDVVAVRAVRAWAAEARLSVVELRRGGKQLYSAGLTAAGVLLGPVLDAASRLLRASGLNPVETRRILAYVAENALRAQQAHGRKAWPNPAQVGRREAVRAQLAAADRLDGKLGAFERRMLLACLEFHGVPADWLESHKNVGKARPGRIGAHPE